MGKFTLTHEINCDAETFWKLFFDKTYNERLYREALGFPAYDILEQTETDTQIVRKVAGQPKMNVPGPVMKLLGAGFRYTEDGTFDKKTQIWRWRLTPSTLADKLRQEGTMRLEPIGQGKVRRVAELINEAKVFGVGGLIESSAEKSLREGFDQSAVFTNQYVKQQQRA